MTMKGHDFTNKQMLNVLISEYEAMSQEGTVGFYEETVFLRIIEHYENGHDIENALSAIDHALSQHPFSYSLLIRKAHLLMDKDCFHSALETLEKAEAYSPTSIEIKLAKVEVLVELNYVEDAFEIIYELKSRAIGREKSEIYIQESRIYEQLNNYDKMFDTLRKALQITPENHEALERIIWATELSGRYLESIELHRKIIDIAPYCGIAWFNLGLAYSCQDDHESAIDAFEYAFIVNEKCEFAYRECAESCIKLGRFEKALECYEEALEKKIKPDSDLFLKIGYCYEQLNNLPLAKSFFEKSLKLDPQNGDAYYRMGECYSAEERWNRAVTAYQKAIALNDRKEEYLSGLAEAYYQTGKEVLAQEYFRKAADTAPEYSKYWIQYASFLVDTDRVEDALNLLEEAYLYTNGTELMYCRIVCLFEIGKRAEALYLLGQALMDNYDMHDSLFLLQPTLQNDRDIINMIATYQPV